MDRPAPFAPAHLRRLLLWLALLCISLALLLAQGHWEGVWLAEWTGAPYPVALVPGTVLMVFTAALLCEFMDTGLGMGFGTLMAAFSKGVSGGGYGPLVTSGQIVCGMPARQAVAITSIAEALTCLVVLMGYVAVKGAPDWTLALPLAGGALLAVPWATLGVHHLPQTWLRAGVGVLTLALGLWSLVTLLLA